jgi:hypothetical protein
VAAVREGCIGESAAALLLGERARLAEVPIVREKLQRIAEDEARHAELAWRFVAWALGQGDAKLHAAVAEAFRALHVETLPGAVEEEHELLRAHGRLSRRDAATLEARALALAIEPCAAALLCASVLSPLVSCPWSPSNF